MIPYFEFQLVLFAFTQPEYVKVVQTDGNFQVLPRNGIVLIGSIAKSNDSWMQVGGGVLPIETVKKLGAKKIESLMV